MKRILFSTIGMTDPIKNDYDGPLLHIIRHYRPEKAYLFMTQRVCELADQDNRYQIHVERLCAQEGFHCEVIELRHDEIDKPQEFDIFYPLFEREIYAIHKDNPGSQILINLSSGTPQMKSACQLVALTTPFPVLPIQVTTPKERENYGSDNYDIEGAWENNIDNHSEMGPKNRCLAVEAHNLRFLFLREAAISHIEAYDYQAALDVLYSVGDFISQDALDLLEAAKHRRNMELKEAAVLANKANYDLFPIKSSNVIALFEYLLRLKLQQKNMELMDFVRGISPALTNLFECFLEEKCKRRVKRDYCYESPKGSNYWKLSRSKLAQEKELLEHYDSIFFGGFKDTYLSCASLLPMIAFDCGPNGQSPNGDTLKKAQEMRNVEEKIRNPAAHNIVAITEEQFEKEAGISSRKLLQSMMWMFKHTFPQHFSPGADEWNSYDIMNKEIVKRLKTKEI